MPDLKYAIPDFLEQAKNTVRVLSFDPGSVNMGCSLVEYDKSLKTITVLANTVLTHPLHDIKSFIRERQQFVDEVQAWISAGKPSAIIAERFQSRGLRGTTIECVCIMLGILSSFGLPVLFTTAATWKNRYQKRFNVDLRQIYNELQVAPHQLDSALIGCFGLESGTKQYIDFSIDDVIAQVADTSLIPLKIKKNRRFRDEDA